MCYRTSKTEKNNYINVGDKGTGKKLQKILKLFGSDIGQSIARNFQTEGHKESLLIYRTLMI